MTTWLASDEITLQLIIKYFCASWRCGLLLSKVALVFIAFLSIQQYISTFNYGSFIHSRFRGPEQIEFIRKKINRLVDKDNGILILSYYEYLNFLLKITSIFLYTQRKIGWAHHPNLTITNIFLYSIFFILLKYFKVFHFYSLQHAFL